MKLGRKPLLVATSIAISAGAITVSVPAIAEGTRDIHVTAAEQVAAGVKYSAFTTDTPHGELAGHLLDIDMTTDGTTLGLLTTGRASQKGIINELADDADAVGGINGDFFDMVDTGSAVGPAVVDGKALKASVPEKQRVGPPLPKGTSNEDVFGVTDDGQPTMTSLGFDGAATANGDSFKLSGLNQYALAENSVGVFTPRWGESERERATCGSDDGVNEPCADRVKEVKIAGGKVAAVSDKAGEGAIAADESVLLARDDGVDKLDGLAIGDKVSVDYGLSTPNDRKLDMAIGGMPIIKAGKHLGLDDSELAPRTGIGISADGKSVYLVAIEGRNDSSVGATIESLAGVLTDLGADSAVNLDGGGSTVLAARKAGDTKTTVRTDPSGSPQRPVANGVGVFAK